jgi:hypothetical protein
VDASRVALGDDLPQGVDCVVQEHRRDALVRDAGDGLAGFEPPQAGSGEVGPGVDST